MPITTGKDTKGCYAQWGKQKKHYYECGNTKAKDKAKQKAQIQGSVISRSAGIKYKD
jgi:hypothetical protein